ncbi:MAG TPA: YciI family protein [Terriglobales bacterium]|nr:YciI family protein [Terriglobales bacterium]
MPQFLFLLYDDPSKWREMSPQELQTANKKYMGWGEKARQAGFVRAGQKLVDDAGKVLRGPQRAATDGPYSETKELAGGYYVIEAANYDEAVRGALDHPHLQYGGTIEIRQVEELPSQPT